MPNSKDDLYNNLDAKVDSIREDISEIKITSAKQEVNLKNHMRRTELNEESLRLFEKKVLPALQSYSFIATVIKTGSKVIIFVATLAGIWYEYKKG